MVNIGQYKNMEESSELTRSSGNINRDGNQQCIKYEREELIGIASKCMQDNQYRILNRETCVKIRYFRLNRRYRRYRRGGKKCNIAYRKLTQQDNSLNIDNLVSINCNDWGSDRDRNSDNMLIALVNAQSLRSKELLLHDYIKEDNIDICIVTETWIQNTEEDKAWCEISALNNDNLMLHTVNREEHRGGGLALVSKSSLTISKLEMDKPNSFEAAKWKVSLLGKSITVIAVYRPPYSKAFQVTISMFMDEFTAWIADQLTTESNILLMGDFNMQTNKIDTDADIKTFMDIIEALGLQQWVDFGTHHLGNTIDLVFNELASNIEIVKCTLGPFISDHCIVKCEINYKRDRPIEEYIRYHRISKIDTDAYTKDLLLTKITDDLELDTMIDVFQQELVRVLDEHAPLIGKRLQTRKPKPWFREDIKEQKQKVRRRERIWRRYREDHQWLAFKSEKKKYREMLKEVKINSVSKLIIECGRDVKKLYQVIYNMAGKCSLNPLPNSDNDKDLADNFANYFIDKIRNIRDQLDEYPKYDPKEEAKDIPTLLGIFNQIAAEDIMSIVGSMASKSCKLDVVPTSLFKAILPNIIDTLVRIINASLEQGVFTRKWKRAIVKPLLKKSGLELIFKNYRPVSNLCFLSKVLEKCALKQLDEHCKKYAPLPDYQSSYRKYYSCETALVKLMNDILWNMECGDVTAFIAIDLLAAFDTVDHGILLDVLQYQFGVKGMVRKWFDSYLSPRQFQVNIGKAYSDPIDLQFSVPQGSCAGPILFLLYASTIGEVIPQDIDIHGYADYHGIKSKFKAKEDNNEAELETIQGLESCLEDVKVWMDEN